MARINGNEEDRGYLNGTAISQLPVIRFASSSLRLSWKMEDRFCGINYSAQCASAGVCVHCLFS